MKAPSLFDPDLGTVHVWSKDGKVPRALADLINENVKRVGHKHTDTTGVVSTPEARAMFAWDAKTVRRQRFYVTAGQIDKTSVVNSHLFGAPHGPTCLPTKRSPGAGQWLREQIAMRVGVGLDVLICVKGGSW